MDIDFLKDYSVSKDDLANAELIKKFHYVYDTVMNGNGHAMNISSLYGNEPGGLLLDTCKHMRHAPVLSSIINPVAACSDTFGEYHVLLYLYRISMFSMCENAYVILILCNDRLRMFTVETHGTSYMLCEYCDGKHCNYGMVSLPTLPQTLLQIIK